MIISQGSKKSEFLNNFFCIVAVFAISVYPLLLPLNVSIAEDSAETSSNSESENSEEASSDADNAEEESEEENSGEESSSSSETQEGSSNEENSGEQDVDETVETSETIQPAENQETQPENTEAVSENSDVQEFDIATCSMEENEKNLLEQFVQCKEKQSCDEAKSCIAEENGKIAAESSDVPQTENPVQEEAITSENTAENESSEENSSEEENASEENPIADPAANETPSETQSGEIVTQDAVAEADVYNEENINIVSGNYDLAIYNIYGEKVGDINLLEAFNYVLENAGNQIPDSSGGEVTVVNENDSELENNAEASADTGNNSASGGGASSNVETGDASAYANIVNFVNQNIVGENWLLSVINIFGNWNGDLIVPGNGLIQLPGGLWGMLVEVENDNEANIQNNVNAESNTGNNTVEGEGASIQTGDAASSANVENMVNTNITDDNWFNLLINNLGFWNGEVSGWEGDNSQDHYSYEFEQEEQEDGTIKYILKVVNKNVANIVNYANAYANTGNNVVSGSGGNITTGNAFSAANIVNMVNNNFVGNNWMFVVINIMGSWKGNAVFAYPDLQVTVSDGKDDIKAGEKADYTVEVKNVGKAEGKNVNVKFAVPSVSGSESNFEWGIEALEPGESKTFSTKVAFNDDISGEKEILAVAQANTETKETELQNNSASDSTVVYNPSDAKIKVERKILPGTDVSQGGLVDNLITIENSGDSPVYNIVVEDTVKNNLGKIEKYSWPIYGELKEKEKILVQYQVQIGSSAPLGMYENKAIAYGYDPQGDEIKSKGAYANFNVLAGYFPVAQAEENSYQEAVQGEEIVKVETNSPKKAVLPLLLFLSACALTSAYAYERKRRRRRRIPLGVWVD